MCLLAESYETLNRSLLGKRRALMATSLTVRGNKQNTVRSHHFYFVLSSS